MIDNKVVNFMKSNNPVFLSACAEVPPPLGKVALFDKEGKLTTPPGIPATRRQASKWLMGKGIARKHMGTTDDMIDRLFGGVNP